MKAKGLRSQHSFNTLSPPSLSSLLCAHTQQAFNSIWIYGYHGLACFFFVARWRTTKEVKSGPMLHLHWHTRMHAKCVKFLFRVLVLVCCGTCRTWQWVVLARLLVLWLWKSLRSCDIRHFAFYLQMIFISFSLFAYKASTCGNSYWIDYFR